MVMGVVAECGKRCASVGNATAMWEARSVGHVGGGALGHVVTHGGHMEAWKPRHHLRLPLTIYIKERF